MNRRIIPLLAVLLVWAGAVRAQWVVSDPSNLAQGIVNSTQQIAEAAKNGQTMWQSFQEFFDALKAVSNLVRNARKVQRCILLVGEISDIYMDGYRRMLADENFSPTELGAIAVGYAKIIEDAAGALRELRDTVNPADLSLTDKDRIDVVERVYGVLRGHRDLARYYTRKQISISLLRSRERGNVDRILSLYGTDEQRYW